LVLFRQLASNSPGAARDVGSISKVEPDHSGQAGHIDPPSTPDPVGIPNDVEANNVEGPEWSPDSNQFVADVYPSARSAAGALAGRVDAQIDKVWQGAEAPDVVNLAGPNWSEYTERIKQAILARWPQVNVKEKVALSSEPPEGKAGELGIAICFNGCVGVVWDISADHSGEAVLIVRGPGGTSKAEAAYVRKPWADNFSVYLARQSADRRWILVSSPGPCTSANEAQKKAYEEAARRLAPLVRQAMDRISSGSNLNGQELAGRIEPELQRRGLVQDQFLQRFHRPYGDVWKESLLIGAHPGVVETLAQDLSWNQNRIVQARRSSWARTGLSIAGLVVLICMVYLFLNAVTRGYYVRPLRTAAAIVGLLILAGALLLLVA
jgi:hypothetical protein